MLLYYAKLNNSVVLENEQKIRKTFWYCGGVLYNFFVCMYCLLNCWKISRDAEPSMNQRNFTGKADNFVLMKKKVGLCFRLDLTWWWIVTVKSYSWWKTKMNCVKDLKKSQDFCKYSIAMLCVSVVGCCSCDHGHGQSVLTGDFHPNQ